MGKELCRIQTKSSCKRTVKEVLRSMYQGYSNQQAILAILLQYMKQRTLFLNNSFGQVGKEKKKKKTHRTYDASSAERGHRRGTE